MQEHIICHSFSSSTAIDTINGKWTHPWFKSLGFRFSKPFSSMHIWPYVFQSKLCIDHMVPLLLGMWLNRDVLQSHCMQPQLLFEKMLNTNIESQDLLGFPCIYSFLQKTRDLRSTEALQSPQSIVPSAQKLQVTGGWSTYFLLAYTLTTLFIPPALVFHKKATSFREQQEEDA